MSIAVVARGRIVEGPVEISSEDGPLTSFMLGDAQFGIHRGAEYLINDLTVIEVTCRGSLAGQVLENLTVDQNVVVVGSAHLSKPLDYYDDRELVLVTIEPETVGVDLGRVG